MKKKYTVKITHGHPNIRGAFIVDDVIAEDESKANRIALGLCLQKEPFVNATTIDSKFNQPEERLDYEKLYPATMKLYQDIGLEGDPAYIHDIFTDIFMTKPELMEDIYLCPTEDMNLINLEEIGHEFVSRIEELGISLTQFYDIDFKLETIIEEYNDSLRRQRNKRKIQFTEEEFIKILRGGK